MCSPRERCTPRPVETTAARREVRSVPACLSTVSGASRVLSPPPARRKRVAGRGWGWGVLSAVSIPAWETAEPPPTPDPSPPLRGGRGEEGAADDADAPIGDVGQSEPAPRSRSAPPASAKIRPASCRRRSAQSAARSGRHGLLPADRADARAATSRARRTSGGNGPAAVRPVRSEMLIWMRGGTASELCRL